MRFSGGKNPEMTDFCNCFLRGRESEGHCSLRRGGGTNDPLFPPFVLPLQATASAAPFALFRK